MTFWTTLYYAGSVVMTMGYEGQTLEQCEDLSEIIIKDINFAYEQNIPELEISEFPENKFSISCETEMLPIDEAYE